MKDLRGPIPEVRSPILALFGLLANLMAAPAQLLAQAPAGPLSPEAAIQGFRIDPDLKIELAAAEPDVLDPVFVAFDSRHRMWVVQMADYPNGPAAGEPGTSSIRVLSDPDGDGRFGNPVVFAEGLLFANSLMFWQDGVLVTTDGRLDFFADRDGDGRAEFRETWFEGFSRENPQLRANSPTLGHDGLIYVANGLRGGKVVARRREWGELPPVDISGRDFCFDPFTGKAAATTGHGQFGMSFDDAGRRYVCSNRNPCIQVVFPEWALAKNPGVAVTAVVADVAVSGEASRIYPISRFWTTSNLHAGQFTAACGVHLYRGDGLGSGFRGNAFTCDPTGNLVHREILDGTDVVFRGRSPYDAREFLATEDTWFRPVNLATGPDGALYIADMYRAVIEHPQFMPEELKTRPDLNLGRDRGRVYRIVPKTGLSRREPAPAVHQLAAAELLPLLDHPNVWQRETAFRTLIERQDRSVGEDAARLVAAAATSAGRVMAFSVVQCLGAPTDELLAAAARSVDPDLAEQALLAAGRIPAEDWALRYPLLKQSVIDRIQPAKESPALTARMRFLLALAVPPEPALLASLLANDLSSTWLQTAVLLSAKNVELETADRLLQGFLAGQAPSATIVEPLGRLLERACAGGDVANLATSLRLIEKLADRDRESAMSIRSSLWTRLAQVLRARGRDPRKLLIEASATAGVPFENILDSAISRAASPQIASPQLIDLLRMLELAEEPGAVAVLRSSLNSRDSSVAAAAVATLAKFPGESSIRVLLEGYTSRSPALRREIQAAVFRSEPRIALFLDEIDAGRIPANELDQTRMQALARVKDSALKERAQKLIAANRPADRSEVIQQYQVALSRKGDPAHGRELFTKNCSQCHRIGGIGVNVAPDISDSRVKLPSQLLTDILDPNRAIDNNYFNYLVIDAEGTIYNGVIATETSTSITLRQPEDKRVTIARDNIEQIRSTGQSLMPVGLEKSLTVEDMSDLISFIKNWRYLDGEVPAEVIR